MRRIFSHPIAALFAGAALRLLFVLRLPAESGDAVIYEQLARNWAKLGKYAMTIAGQAVPVDLRMPGYPGFLAVTYLLSGRTGERARIVVMLAQVFVDLFACVVTAALAALLFLLCYRGSSPKRIFVVALWLSALCPFTANYVAVPLTEVWAGLLTVLPMLVLVALTLRLTGAELPALPRHLAALDSRILAALAGFLVGLATLFRPEAPLLLITTVLLLAFWLLRRGNLSKFIVTCALMAAGCALPLLPWTIRNAVTLHEFQPLAPKDATLPGELDPKGLMAWEKTWLYRFRDCYLVPWKLNDEEIRMDDIPTNAFDSEEERGRVKDVLDRYNEDTTWTGEEDAAMAQIARGRTARHPLRTYLWIPLRRSVRIWFTPRIELLTVSGNVFPLAVTWDEDPVDQVVTSAWFLLNIAYVALALWGIWKLWSFRGARAAVIVLVFYVLVRTAFLTTLETPEPRYVLVCFPALFAFAAQVLVRPGTSSAASKTLPVVPGES